MDVLSRLIKRGVRERKYDTSISHFMYVDDILLFYKANIKSLHTIKDILEEFIKFTGLEVNSQKSSVTFSKVCEENPDLHNILGFTIKVSMLDIKKTIEKLLSRWSSKCL